DSYEESMAVVDGRDHWPSWNVSAAVLPYDEACKMCGGHLSDYISKDSTPRIVKIGDGCPCGGTHVVDIFDINDIKVPPLRSKKGMTKVFYNIPD
ncbi:hypothetical protein Drorol1_Dr00008900, partial [Drosera rotundifolia]